MFFGLYRFLRHPAIVTSLLVTILVSGGQKTGILQGFELKVFDQMMSQWADHSPDPRLLVVTVTEQDLQTLGQFPLTDQTLANLWQKLARYQPRVVGLDILRDLPVAPGTLALRQQLEQDDRAIVICKHQTAVDPAVPAPPLAGAAGRIGFSDIVEDNDGMIRRNLLLVTPQAASPCAAAMSFSGQLVSRYLGTRPVWTADRLEWGRAQMPRLQPTTGGYQLSVAAAQGYQILGQYRVPVARQVSLADVLNDRIDPSWVRDRIVLVGITAPSVKDVFNTPYSAGQTDNFGRMAGILLHAQMTSQLLSAVIDGRSQIWSWPDGGEWLWAWLWALMGGGLAGRLRQGRRLCFSMAIALGSLVVIHMGLFSRSVWVPLAPPLLGLLLTSLSVGGDRLRQNAQQQAIMRQKLHEQQNTIALLQTLLHQVEAPNNNATAITIADVPNYNDLLNQRYRITARLGIGGFSRTYLAEDTQLPGHPLCVVKHLRPARSDESFLHLARRLFKTEADILALLGRHPKIPQLLAFFEDQQEFYLVQEYILGEPLTVELHSGQLRSPQVIELLKEVLTILVFVHGQGVIHRDLKPSNLIRHVDGHVALIDFGAVKQIQPQQEADHFTVAIGTVGYAPPEQFMGQPRLNSDIYALGIIAIEALTGIAPKQLQRNAVGAVIWQRAVVSPALATILDRMTATNVDQRYATATDVLQDLAQVM